MAHQAEGLEPARHGRLAGTRLGRSAMWFFGIKTEASAPHLHVVLHAEQPADRSAVGHPVAVVVADERLNSRVGLGSWGTVVSTRWGRFWMACIYATYGRLCGR